jgi:type II secretory pathway pseudopilin PulG
MMKSISIRRRPQPSEEGYILVAVIFMLALLMISLSLAAPRIKADIQRDRELETMQRGKQYIRAIKMYYKKFGAYPPNINALIKTSNIRFLRKKYIDPTTGKDEWKPIHFGQNKVPTAMGFFGKALSGSSLAGTGTSGGNSSSDTSTLSSGFGSTSGSSIFSSSASGTSSTATTGSTIGSSDTSSSTSTTGSSSAFGSSTSSTGETFGGAGIIGFSPMSPKQSIMVYKKKNHYNEWEFVYDPRTDQTVTNNSSGAGGKSASSISTGIGSSSSSIGSSSTFSSGSSSTSTTTTTQ